MLSTPDPNDLQTLSRTVPFGIIKFASGEAPQITYISDTMLEILRYSAVSPQSQTPEQGQILESGATALGITMQNVYMLIPPEDQKVHTLPGARGAARHANLRRNGSAAFRQQPRALLRMDKQSRRRRTPDSLHRHHRLGAHTKRPGDEALHQGPVFGL